MICVKNFDEKNVFYSKLLDFPIVRLSMIQKIWKFLFKVMGFDVIIKNRKMTFCSIL